MQKNLIIRPGQITGKIKPLHGVGGGPLSCHFSMDATEEFREAGIPFGRTHDIEYPFGTGEFHKKTGTHPVFFCVVSGFTVKKWINPSIKLNKGNSLFPR